MVMNSTTTKAQLLSDRRVAQLLEVSRRKVWTLVSTAGIPEPIRIGRSVRWRAEEIDEWVRLGCPSRQAFEAAREANT